MKIQNLALPDVQKQLKAQGTGQPSLLHLEQYLSQKSVKYEIAVPIKILIQNSIISRDLGGLFLDEAYQKCGWIKHQVSS